MQINSASLLAAQQAQQARPPAQSAQRAATKASEDLFEPLLFGKADAKPAQTAQTAAMPTQAAQSSDAQPKAYARPGSQIDIRV